MKTIALISLTDMVRALQIEYGFSQVELSRFFKVSVDQLVSMMSEETQVDQLTAARISALYYRMIDGAQFW